MTRNGKPQSDRYLNHTVHCKCRQRCAELAAALHVALMWCEEAKVADRAERELTWITRQEQIEELLARKPEVSK